MKKTTLSLSFFALLFLSPLAAENALEIASRFDVQKVEAIQTYLKENPEAEDKDQAFSILVDAYMSLGQLEPIPDLLTQRYDAMEKGANADLPTIINEITRPFIESCRVSNQRDKAKAFLARVKEDLAPHPQGAQVGQFLDQLGGELSLPGIGDEMKIAFTDLNGKEVDLSAMQDKVILVDFWATWCGPCVAEMPNVIAAYDTYHSKGFEVIGISLDENKAAVEKFIADNKMPWSQHFDGKGWGNELAKEFGIQSIPATFLIGKGGKIVASNLHGPALEAAVVKALEANP